MISGAAARRSIPRLTCNTNLRGQFDLFILTGAFDWNFQFRLMAKGAHSIFSSLTIR